MRGGHRIVVTQKEVLHLLGVKRVTLEALENAARIREVPGRMGYTCRELNSLKGVLKRIVASKKIL